MVPSTLPFNPPIRSVLKVSESWRTMMNNCKLSQMVILVTTAVPRVVSMLEQIKASFGTYYVATDLANAFFSILIHKGHQNQFAFNCLYTRNTLLLSYLRGTLTLQTCVMSYCPVILITVFSHKVSYLFIR